MLPRFLTNPLTRLALPLAGALFLASCASGQAPAMAGSLSMTLTEFKYTPAQLEASAGAPLTLTLTNGGTVEHDFVIDVARIHVKLQPGQKAEQAFGPLAAGTYEIYCSIPGHKEAGMKGKLTVK